MVTTIKTITMVAPLPIAESFSVRELANSSMAVLSVSHVWQEGATHDHAGPGDQDQCGDPFGAHRGFLAGLGFPERVGDRVVENRDAADRDEGDLRHEGDLIQIAW